MTWYIVFTFTLACAVTDYRKYLIYDKITLPALATGLLFHITPWGFGNEYALVRYSFGVILGRG